MAQRRGQKQRHRRLSSNRQITGPDQLWQFDIKCGYIPGENRYFYLCGFIDVFSRKVLDFHIGLRCTAEDILATLRRALQVRSIDDNHHLIIRSDTKQERLHLVVSVVTWTDDKPGALYMVGKWATIPDYVQAIV